MSENPQVALGWFFDSHCICRLMLLLHALSDVLQHCMPGSDCTNCCWAAVTVWYCIDSSTIWWHIILILCEQMAVHNSNRVTLNWTQFGYKNVQFYGFQEAESTAITSGMHIGPLLNGTSALVVESPPRTNYKRCTQSAGHLRKHRTGCQW